jgi:hypothetical protein
MLWQEPMPIKFFEIGFLRLFNVYRSGYYFSLRA